MKNPTTLIINSHPRLKTSLRSLKINSSKIINWLKLGSAYVEITLCDDAFMRVQNRKHMGKSGTTDVLSFPQLPPQTDISRYRGKFLGDILISLDQASRQAKEQGISLQNEVLFLVIHSVLHLIGHDHFEKTERLCMQKLESEIWLDLRRRPK